jgi:hypothetical protein
MFRRKNHTKRIRQVPKPPGTFVVPRTAVVAALARASYDGNPKAVAAAQRLLDSPYDYFSL